MLEKSSNSTSSYHQPQTPRHLSPWGPPPPPLRPSLASSFLLSCLLSQPSCRTSGRVCACVCEMVERAVSSPCPCVCPPPHSTVHVGCSPYRNPLDSQSRCPPPGCPGCPRLGLASMGALGHQGGLNGLGLDPPRPMRSEELGWNCGTPRWCSGRVGAVGGGTCLGQGSDSPPVFCTR